jgi:hypothetical protein
MQRHDGMDHFAMGGFLIPSEDVQTVIDGVVALRTKYDISAPFHSTKIRRFKGDWSWLGTKTDKSSSFMYDLSTFLCSMPGHATACVVHRPGYVLRYSHFLPQERWRLCKSAYAILVERAAKIAHRDGRKLIVYVEQTGPLEDKQIREYHLALYQSGMIFDPNTSAKYNPLSHDSFNKTLTKNPNFFTKANYLGQIADLLLYPLVKGKYDPSYRPYQLLKSSGKIIDDGLAGGQLNLGVKYYCFDVPKEKGPGEPEPFTPPSYDDARPQLAI